MLSFIDDLVKEIKIFFDTITPKPKFEQGMVGLVDGFYLINSDTNNYTNTQYITTGVIALKHKVITQGRGMMEAEIRLKELSKFLNDNYLVADENFKSIGIVDTNFIQYNYLFTIISNK